jgi:hypothetical protein
MGLRLLTNDTFEGMRQYQQHKNTDEILTTEKQKPHLFKSSW